MRPSSSPSGRSWTTTKSPEQNHLQPLEEVPTDKGTTKGEEAEKDVIAPLVAECQAPEVGPPRQCALHHPPVVAQPLARLDAPRGDTALDAPAAAGVAAAREVVRFVGMQLLRALPGPPPGPLDGWNGIDQLLDDAGVVDIGRRHHRGEGDTLPLDHNMALRARFAAVRWSRPGGRSPFVAGMLAESSAARDQSMASRSPKRSSSTWWSRSHTPAACQSRGRRQQGMPLPQPSSRGSLSQGMPLLSTTRMPVSAARSSRRGRPPLGLGGCGGSSGASTSHSSSDTSAFARAPVSQTREGFW